MPFVSGLLTSICGKILKGEKLRTPTINLSNGKEFPTTIDSLDSKLKRIKEHLVRYDMIDVLTVVNPTAVKHSPQISSTTYDLLEDHSKLHPDQVANSNAWYGLWVLNAYILENMMLIYQLLSSQ